MNRGGAGYQQGYKKSVSGHEEEKFEARILVVLFTSGGLWDDL